MTNIKLMPLTEHDLSTYTALYEASFPASERKELDYMLKGPHASAYDVLVISTPDHPVAGMVITVTHGGLCMLDYFAVSPDLRGRGIGTAVLPLIRQISRGHFFLEIETPAPYCDPRDACPNPEQRVRRKAFYLSAGMVETGVRAFIYGNDMELLAFPEDAEAVTFEGYDALLKATFPAGMEAERI